MLLQAVAVALTAAGLALCLDLEAVQRTTHFPQHKRSGGDDVGQRERIFSELLSRRMAKLLPVLLREQEEGKHWVENEDPTTGLRRNLLLPHSQRLTSRFAPVHGALKRMAKKKLLGGRGEKRNKASGNRRVPRLDGAMGAMRRRSVKAGERRQKGSLTKRDAKVLGELRQIFSDEQKPDPKTPQKRDVADIGKDQAVEGQKNETDEEKFKKWLLDEYYRTMALSFASMRKKRMASSHQAPSLQTDGESNQDMDDDRFQAAEDRLRGMEESLLTEALALERSDAGGPDENRVAARLDAAYDLESVRRALDHLHSALRIIQMQDEQDTSSGSSNKLEAQTPSSNPQQCRVLQVLTSGCSALENLLPVDAAFKARLVTACNWHEVCYTCGSLFDLTPEDCDEGYSDGDSGGQVLELLRERRVFMKRSAPAACSAPCVQEFLGSP
ncbi:uncharacterized protein LOC135366231 [Ornithodoros turicata]|uniref:uncharacterized protein LOC135366231 n=1 Tax=Ornithodoros turicata TaxID=34597 RepID=UPI003139FE5F